jgi:hypothetical protein
MVTGLPFCYDSLVNNLQDNDVIKMKINQFLSMLCVNILFCVLETCNVYLRSNMYVILHMYAY